MLASLYQVPGFDPQTSETIIFNGTKSSVSLIQFNASTFKMRHSVDTVHSLSPTPNTQMKEPEAGSPETYSHPIIDDFCILFQ